MNYRYMPILIAFVLGVIVWEARAISLSYLERFDFHRAEGKEGIVLSLSQPVTVTTKSTPTHLEVALEGCFVPDDFKGRIGTGKLVNVSHITAEQREEGERKWALVAIWWKRPVPFTIRTEGTKVAIDFINVPTSVPISVPTDTPSPAVEKKNRISVDFQKADIRAVIRLLAEQAGKNIVLSPDVKGEVTLTMKDVTWETVLDTIAGIYGLVKREISGVITLVSFEKMTKDQAERRAAEENRIKAEEFLKEIQRKAEAEKGKTRQILVEAKIVEASTTFTRSLGVQWWSAFHGTWSGGKYTAGFAGGTATATTPVTQLSPNVAMIQTPTSDGPLALNFSSTLLNPSFGILIGGANAMLSARLNASETEGETKVVSSPRVIISDGEKAVIEQGEEIPVVTPATANNPASTTYKDAVLRLQVTPKIIVNDYVLLEILAQNDRAEKAEKDPATGNMPIYKNKVDSRIAIKNGDTIVIGGVRTSEDSQGTTGVPWLSKIPILGWLFKSEEINRSTRELLIFITPRILPASEPMAQK